MSTPKDVTMASKLKEQSEQRFGFLGFDVACRWIWNAVAV